MSKTDTTDASGFLREVRQLVTQFDAIMNFCEQVIEIRQADRLERRETFELSIPRQPLVNETAFWTISNEYAKLREIVAAINFEGNTNFNSVLRELREMLARAKKSEGEL